MEFIGILYLAIIFILCFCAVALLRLASFGMKYIRRKNEPKPPAPKKESKAEPVYYIVEKKRARRASYSQPREIKFKEK